MKVTYKKKQIKKQIKMDFTNIKCISENCKDKNTVMQGFGGQTGGRMTIAKVKCLECDLTLLILPMSKEYEYEISATTKEERIDERIKKAKEESELGLAKTITRIKEMGY